MDGLRGFLAVYVMLGHALPFTTLPGWVGLPFSHGEAAVDLFFCLSGLVIMSSREHHRTAGRFLAARARRLMPVYVIVLTASLWLLAAGDPLAAMPWVGAAAREFWAPGLPPAAAAHIVAHLTLTQGLIPQWVLPYGYITLLGPAWSLSAEAQFYVLTAWAGGRARLMLLGLLGLAAMWAVAPGGGAWAMSRAFLPAAAGYFALGLASGLWWRGHGPGWLVLCVAACCLLGGGGEKLLIPLAWACVLGLQTGRLGAVLESRAMLWLGAISYPLYLVNEPVQRALALLIAPHRLPFTPVWLPLALAVPVLVAWALHVMIETPFAAGRLALLPSRPIRPI